MAVCMSVHNLVSLGQTVLDIFVTLTANEDDEQLRITQLVATGETPEAVAATKVDRRNSEREYGRFLSIRQM